jgi:hypothetical protein
MSTTKVTDALRAVTEVDAAKITTGTIPEARITTLDATKLTGTVDIARVPSTAVNANVDLTTLSATNLTSGTVADARLPATALNSNVDLTALSASNLTSGTVADARLPSTALNSNVDLTTLSASNLTSGTVANARLDTGTSANKLVILDGSGALPAISGANLTGIAVATDLTSVHQGIATLGLHMGVADNKVAFNLPNSFIDIFQDSSGITTTTDTTRNASEYVSSVTSIAGVTIPTNTKMLFHMDAADGTGTFTDSSAAPHTITNVNSATHTTTAGNYHFGTSAGNFTASNEYIHTAGTADTAFGTGEFYVGIWVKINNISASQNVIFTNRDGPTNSTYWFLYSNAAGSLRFDTAAAHIFATPDAAVTTGVWTHIAVSRNSSNLIQIFVNGVVKGSATSTNDFSSSGKLYLGYDPAGGAQYNGWYDEFILIKGSGGHVVAFTPETTSYGTTLGTSATGTLISDAQTAAESTTEVSGVILYTDNAGTNTLGTGASDSLSIWFSATNGTGNDWVQAASYGASQVFSGSIKQVKLGKTTVPAGTQIAIKAVWANQSASKVAHLEGWAVNY